MPSRLDDLIQLYSTTMDGNPLQSGLMDHDQGQTLQRTLSSSSLDSVLPPPLQHKRRVRFLLSVLVPVTLATLVVCCVYSDIAGHAQYWYSQPESWQFCVIYADSTIQLWDKKLVDGVAPSLSYMGLLNTIYTWAALAATFRALFHYEWIPSTIVFLCFNLFGQLCYYQSTNLVTVPPKLPSTLLSVTAWLSSDMYDNMGRWCTASSYSFGTITGEVISNPVPNCTDSVIIIDPEIQTIDSQIEAVEKLTNRTVLDSDLNCGGAVALNTTYVVLLYTLAGITFALILVLWRADREIRRSRPQRHFFQETGADLKGSHYCLWLVAAASAGYVTTSLANLDASLVALRNVKTYHAIEDNTEVITTAIAFTAPIEVVLDININYYLESWLPFKTNQLNMQTVLLIITSMSVLRGHFKQSISAFRLGAVTSLLAAIIQWPAIIGNMETMAWSELWWWDGEDKCIAFHSGLPFYNPDEADSRSYCRDTRFGMVGALLTFVCMHALIYASARVFVANQERPSLVVVGGLGIPPEDGDPFSFNAGDQDFSGYNSPASSGNSNGRPNEPAPRNTPI